MKSRGAPWACDMADPPSARRQGIACDERLAAARRLPRSAAATEALISTEIPGIASGSPLPSFHSAPRRRGDCMRLRKLIGQGFLRATGWKSEGAPPERRRFVLIAAPHTSNWDLAYLLPLGKPYALRISFMMKHTIFRGPFGPLFKSLGGIPIYRHKRGDLVKQMVAAFGERDELVLVGPGQGPRS